MKKNIAVIGGSGFLGYNLSKLFKKKNIEHQICDMHNPDNLQNFTNVNIQDINSLKDLSNYECLINLAAVHRDDVKPKTLYYDVNVNGAKNLCDFATSNNIKKIIFTSSVAIYGFAPANTNESGQPNYFNEYGRTKYLAEQVFRKWQEEDKNNRTLIIIRPTVIFGEGNRGNVYNLLKQIASKRFVMFGNGKNRKSMAYVENVAAFIEYSLSFKPGLHIYNYIDKPDFDMNTLVSESRNTLFRKKNVGIRLPAFIGMIIGYLADIFSKITGKTISVSSIRVKKFMGTTQFSSSVSETGFIPSVNLHEGLARTLRYEFIENNKDNRTFETE